MAENEQGATAADSDPLEDAPEQLSRVELIWRLFLFQLKLVMDGLRDILLSPVSFVAAIVGLVIGGATPDRYWRQLMRFGRRTDVWINLFDQHAGGADALVQPLEQMMKQDPKRRSQLAQVERFFERLSRGEPGD